jgi:LPS export ABC transporter protein LptC
LAKRITQIKILVVAVIFISCAVIVTVFVYYRRSPDLTRDLVSSIPAGADLTIANIHQTATRDGRKEWSLDAASARYQNAEKQVILSELSMTFYLENQQDLKLTADSGVLLTESKDVEVKGNVVLKSGDAQMKTEDLRYRHAQRILASLSPVEITGASYRLTARRMQIDLNTNRATFEGDVRGAFIEDFSL